MANIQSNGSGGGKFSAGASWSGGTKPGAGDTFQVLNGDVIDCDTTETVSSSASLIDSGGELQITNSGDLTATITNNGKYTMEPGSKLRLSGNFTAGSGSEYDMQASVYDNDSAGTSDIEVYQTGAHSFDGAYKTDLTGDIVGVKFIGGGGANVLYRWDTRTGVLNLRDIILYQFTVNYSIRYCTLKDFGQILALNPGGSYPLISSEFHGDGTLKIKDPSAVTYLPYTCQFYDNTILEIEDSTDGNIGGTANCEITDNGNIKITEQLNSPGYTVNLPKISGNIDIALVVKHNAAKNVFGNSGILNTTGAIIVDASACTDDVRLFYQLKILNWSSVTITMPSQRLYLTFSIGMKKVWTMSRSRTFAILGSPTSIGHWVAKVPQFEPIAYNAGSDLMTIQNDIDADAPNFSDLYESSGWTASTQSLADGGYLKIKTLGWHDTPTSGRTGMNVAIKSFASAAVSNSGTFVEGAGQTIMFRVSHDGGATWSAELTLAELQGNDYPIDGASSLQSADIDTQLEIIYRNNSGSAKTITQQVISGIEFDPDPPTAEGMTTGEQYAAILDAIDNVGGGGGAPSIPYVPVQNNERYTLGVYIASDGEAVSNGAISVDVLLVEENTRKTTLRRITLLKQTKAGAFLFHVKQNFPNIVSGYSYTYFITSGGDTIDTTVGKFSVLDANSNDNLATQMETFKRQQQQQIQAIKMNLDTKNKG